MPGSSRWLSSNLGQASAARPPPTNALASSNNACAAAWSPAEDCAHDDAGQLHVSSTMPAARRARSIIATFLWGHLSMFFRRAVKRLRSLIQQRFTFDRLAARAGAEPVATQPVSVVCQPTRSRRSGKNDHGLSYQDGADRKSVV